MEKVSLGENGPEVSPIIYSFWRALEDPDGISYRTVQAKLQACLDLGITTFDHADIYGNYQVEELFGRAIKESAIKREDLIISTKCGINTVDASKPQYRNYHYDTSAEHIIKSVEQSLKKLSTDYIDVLLLHHYDILMEADETASAITTLVKRGLIKYFGVANFTVHQHQLLQSRLSIPIITNHLELNLLNTKPITDGTLDFIKQQYSRPLAWAPLAGGKLGDQNDVTSFHIANTLKRIAVEYAVNEEQLAIAWLLKLGALPIVGSNNMNRIKNAASAVSINLDRQHWYEIYFSAIHVPAL